MKPLRDILRKDNVWMWGQPQQDPAIQRVIVRHPSVDTLRPKC